MNIKSLLLIPSAIALSLSCFSMVPAIAQTNPTSPRMERGWSQLNLTEAQKAQIKQIRESAKAEMQRLLTPEQLAQFQTRAQNNTKVRPGWKDLNLTAQQKQEMRQIKQRERQQIQAVLTPEQRALLQQRQEEIKVRRQQRQQQSGQPQ